MAWSFPFDTGVARKAPRLPPPPDHELDQADGVVCWSGGLEGLYKNLPSHWYEGGPSNHVFHILKPDFGTWETELLMVRQRSGYYGCNLQQFEGSFMSMGCLGGP